MGEKHTVELYRDAAKERDRLRRDCAILLANIDVLFEVHGNDLDPEDNALIEQIRKDLF